jgi:hypothetical protein
MNSHPNISAATAERAASILRLQQLSSRFDIF